MEGWFQQGRRWMITEADLLRQDPAVANKQFQRDHRPDRTAFVHTLR